MLFLLLFWAGLAAAVSTFNPLRPPAIPLAVRSPYMSTWLPGGNGPGRPGYLPGQWPTFWNGAITGWVGFIRVDGATYTWMGAPNNTLLAEQTAFRYTSTRSIFTLKAANLVQMRVTFLSPVTPQDLKRSSVPFSYMDVEVWSLDGRPHSVQLYTDISAEWVSGNRNDHVQWEYGVLRNSFAPRDNHARYMETRGETVEENAKKAFVQEPNKGETAREFGTKTAYTGWRSTVTHANPEVTGTPALNTPVAFSTVGPFHADAQAAGPGRPINPNPGGIAYHRIYRQTRLLVSEVNNQAQWGAWYYATNNVATLTHQSGRDQDVRLQFRTHGYLNNAQDPVFRAINDNYPVFGYAADLGSVTRTPKSTLFTISLNQWDVVQFQGAGGISNFVQGLWTSYFPNDFSSLLFFFNDYATVSSMTTSIDNKIFSDSLAAAGSNYAAITSLAFRQAFGALQLAGTVANPLMFLKEISSDGNVNTVDVIFPTMPLLLYTNPTLLKLLLDPLFINQESGNWPYMFPIHDIGRHYPNATGHSNGAAEQQPLEEGGNMIIMSLAYAQRTGDVAYLSQHYDILRQWNAYLIQEALIPANQISTDDFQGSLSNNSNQTNLALKGIIGIQAMAEVARLTGNQVDAANFSSIAQGYINQWQTLGIAYNAHYPHTTLSYNTGGFGLLYNLYSDRLLNTSLVPQSIYTMQSNFYPKITGPYGVRLDTRSTVTKSDWEMWCAAVASPSTRNLFINRFVNWIRSTPSKVPLTDLYDTVSVGAAAIHFLARPVVGGFFSILALQA